MADQKRYNLTLVDRQPQVENFVYRGVSKRDKEHIEQQLQDNGRVLKFSYDGGFAIVVADMVHTAIFSDYMTEEQEEEMQRPPREE